MPQLGLSTEPDPVLAAQTQAQVHVLAGRVREPLVERELLRGVRLHAEVQGRHVPEFSPIREQPFPRQGAVDFVIPVQQRGAPGVGHAADGGETGVCQEAGHVTMPITIENAIVVCKEDEVIARGQGFGDGDVPRTCWSAVLFQDDMLDIAVREGVP